MEVRTSLQHLDKMVFFYYTENTSLFISMTVFLCFVLYTYNFEYKSTKSHSIPTSPFQSI